MHRTLLLSILALSTAAQAGTEVPSKAPVPPVPANESSFWFRAAPYVWVTAIEGDVGIGTLFAPIDITMGDTLESLDMGFMGVAEFGRDRWSVGLDFVYGKTSSDIPAGNLVFDSFRFEQQQWILTPFLTYRLVESDGYRMDLVAGARMTILDSELTGRFVGTGEFNRSKGQDWIDPIIGLRGQAELGERFFFRYNGDVGGFGVSSDLTWQAYAGLGYHFTNNISAAIGYRGIGVDYGEDDFKLDTVTHGPVLGLEIKF
jgi:opacity protein-like surface antigen